MPEGRTPQRRFQPLQALQVESWARTMPSLHRAFRILEPAAVYIAALRQPFSRAQLDRDGGVQRWVGGDPADWRNRPRGCWPVSLGVTRVHRDAVTWMLPRDPVDEWVLVYRVWTRGPREGDDADRLHDEAWRRWRAFSLNAGRPQLNHGMIDAGAGFRPQEAAEEVVLGAASDLGIWAKLEGDLRSFLLRAMRAAGVADIADEGGWARLGALLPGLIAAETKERHALSGREVEPARLDAASSPPARGYQMRKMSLQDAEALARWRAQMDGVKLSGE
jgi:hypothetical protein